MRVRLTQKARSDLIAISDHITEQGSVNADTVLRRIAGRYQQLCFSKSGCGPTRSSRRRPHACRRAMARFYLVKPDTVPVLRIVDGAQDLSKLKLPPK